MMHIDIHCSWTGIMLIFRRMYFV